MTVEYFVHMRATRKTSGHEAEELQALLDERAGQGWRLHTVLMQTDQHQMLIFERGNNEQKGGAS